MFPFTLWYSENPVVQKYQDLYAKDLLEIAMELETSFEKMDSKFLLLGDISTTLEAFRAKELEASEALKFLQQEFEYWKSNCKSRMFSFSLNSIPGVAVLLSEKDANIHARVHDGHPEHVRTNVVWWWGNVPVEDWITLYKESFSILKTSSPWFCNELSWIINKIIPMDVSIRVHNSCSYDRCIWHLYLSYPLEIDVPELAVLEALIHESNHNKLNLILKQDPLVLNGRETKYYSPYRPDARHIHGIYLGLHAMAWVFYTLFELHSTGKYLLNHRWLEKATAYFIKDSLSIKVLDRYAQLTDLGKTVYEEMKAVHEETARMVSQCVTPDILNRAKHINQEHFMKVQMIHSDLLY